MAQENDHFSQHFLFLISSFLKAWVSKGKLHRIESLPVSQARLSPGWHQGCTFMHLSFLSLHEQSSDKTQLIGLDWSDGWMASSTQWTCVWAISRSWWWTRKPGVLWSMGSQRVGQNWATELCSEPILTTKTLIEQFVMKR